MNRVRATGFAPVCDEKSRVLILGSFPSVGSRKTGFYYGNPQNRFWRTVCGFFGEEIPATTEDKRAFLLRRRIALWDVIEECDVEGSSDASIRGERAANVPALMARCGFRAVLCNGSKAYELLRREFPACAERAKRLSSTSPANPRFSAEEWNAALREAFGETENDV
ncbi:MAG: DNA-deoxyinosine glycosylase [Candidatus Gallimonas sp.]